MTLQCALELTTFCCSDHRCSASYSSESLAQCTPTFDRYMVGNERGQASNSVLRICSSSIVHG